MRPSWSYRPGKGIAVLRALGAVFFLVCGWYGGGATGWFCGALGAGLLFVAWRGIRARVRIFPDRLGVQDQGAERTIPLQSIRWLLVATGENGPVTILLLDDEGRIELPIHSHVVSRKLADILSERLGRPVWTEGKGGSGDAMHRKAPPGSDVTITGSPFGTPHL